MGVRLPPEYQEVEWIEGTGTQYIDTGLNTAGEIFGFRVCAQYTGVLGSSKEIHYICGSRSNYVTNRLTIQLEGTNTSNYIAIENENITHINVQSISNVHTYEVSPVGIFLDGIQIEGQQVVTRSGYRFYIFNITNGSNWPVANRYWEGKIYKLDILNKVADTIYTFIPCRRVVDSKPGMYDLVTKQFFANAGTGEFLVGPDVIDSISPWLVAWRRMLMNSKENGWTYILRKDSTGRVVQAAIPLTNGQKVYLEWALAGSTDTLQTVLSFLNQTGANNVGLATYPIISYQLNKNIFDQEYFEFTAPKDCTMYIGKWTETDTANRRIYGDYIKIKIT